MIWEWILRGLGLFWFVGGIMTLRALRASVRMDIFMVGLLGGLTDKDLIRVAILSFGAVLTSVSGVLLGALDRFTPVALVANGVVQAVWLLYAARAFPPEGDEDRIGRRQSRNAFLIWVGDTIAIMAGLRAELFEFIASPVAEVGVAVVATFVLAWIVWELVRLRRRAIAEHWNDPVTEADEDDPVDPSEPIDPRVPRRWMLAPNVYTPPLRDADTHQTAYPEDLGLPMDLVAAVDELERDVREALRPSRTEEDVFVLTPEDRARFEAQVKALAAQLAPHLAGGEVEWWLPPLDD